MSLRIRNELLLAHLKQLVGERNAITQPKRLQAAADYIAAQFRAWGLSPQTDVVRRLLWRKYSNIIAELPAAPDDAPLFIVGAHYDSVLGSPGADDNASGVAALLEIARVIAEEMRRGRRRGVRFQFVAFTLEEESMAGSAHYVRVLQKQRAAIAGMISLEMIGYKSDAPHSQNLPTGYEHLYPHVGNFIAVVGNETSRALTREVVGAMKTVEDLPVEHLVVPGNGDVLPPTRLSDHAPFWDAGYRALMITDTSWFRNPHYHQASDTIETLDLDFIARVSEGVARTLLGMSVCG